jgi:hypothetical protein
MFFFLAGALAPAKLLLILPLIRSTYKLTNTRFSLNNFKDKPVLYLDK